MKDTDGLKTKIRVVSLRLVLISLIYVYFIVESVTLYGDTVSY